MVERPPGRYIAGYDVSALWDNGDGQVMPDGVRTCANCDHNASMHMLLSTEDAHRFNPVHHGIELLAKAQSQGMLAVSTSGYRLHGFATANATTNNTMAWLINKYTGRNGTAAPQRVRLTVPPGLRAPNTLVSVLDEADASVPPTERWGVRTAPQRIACSPATAEAEGPAGAGAGASVCEFTLPPVSFSYLSYAAGPRA